MQNSNDPFQLTRFFDKLRTTLSLKKRVKAPLLLEQEKGQGDELGILIACSGGIDSSALVYLMNDVKNELKLRLGVCYVNHKLRAESGDEAKFVDKICQELGIPFFAGELPDNFWEETAKNFEERARVERYKILADIAKSNDFKYIATAHHRDDQVETLLMRILDRGTGIKGLCGIMPVVTHPQLIPQPLLSEGKKGSIYPSFDKRGVVEDRGELTIIRPLIYIGKEEIIKYMEGKQFLTDPTNSDTHFRRNHYRNIVIPALKQVLPDTEFEKRLSDLAENAQRERAVMEEMMREFWTELTTHPDQPYPQPFPFEKGKGDSPLLIHRERSATPGEGVEFYLPRILIKTHSDDFWMTAFSYLFSINPHLDPLPINKERTGKGFSHSTQTLKDITAFIRKTDPGTASYNPYIFKRDRDGVELTGS